MDEHAESESLLGTYLKDRRSKLDPQAFGFSPKRRRTPGLRREEVAQRADISPTWYAWLEQGRGAPSADVLDRLASALRLTNAEREHLFLIGLGRPPQLRYQCAESIAPHLQRVLDALNPSPALIKTATFDVVAWNRAATATMLDFASLTPLERNCLRLHFLNPKTRAAQCDWEKVGRSLVSVFRADTARAGAAASVAPLVAELCRLSPEFEAIWREHDVGPFREIVRHIRHPVAGPIDLEYSAFAVDGRLDLTMVVYNPATRADADKIAALIEAASTLEPT